MSMSTASTVACKSTTSCAYIKQVIQALKYYTLSLKIQSPSELVQHFKQVHTSLLDDYNQTNNNKHQQSPTITDNHRIYCI